MFKCPVKYVVYCIMYSFCFCTFGFPLVAKAENVEVVDRIVAVVNDDIITLLELNRSFKPYAERIRALGYSTDKERKMLFKVREDMLNQLIDQKIKDQEIKRFNIKISEKDIDQAIERIKEANFYTDEDLRAALAKDGLSLEEYRERIKEQILRARLVNIKVKSKIVITKEDIKSYYENHQDKYSGKKKYHLYNIIIKDPLFADEKEKLKIKARMDSILKELNEGKSFETMVNNYSKSFLGAEGGDLGLFGLDELSPQLRNIIKEMKAGEFTSVLDTDHGFQIFLVKEIVQNSGKPLEDVSPEIEEILFNEIVEKKYQSWLEDLRKQSVIKIIK
ncbi:MAG: SurA N-terminal domain-containing protein [Deltaproteobacteria bacterium]|nr:SurA N-terminal domain-containing protein [Deltaproteobacteria bacterium]MBW2641850.1 SurA N-terminal domain-containing protein [Deltaproteobacteria bacterium]